MKDYGIAGPIEHHYRRSCLILVMFRTILSDHNAKEGHHLCVGVLIDDMPNTAQLDLRGHRTQVAYKLYYNVYMVGPELCKIASHR